MAVGNLPNPVVDKYITAESLINLLKKLDHSTRIRPNDVRELSLSNKNEQYIGHIDIAEEELTLFDENEIKEWN